MKKFLPFIMLLALIAAGNIYYSTVKQEPSLKNNAKEYEATYCSMVLTNIDACIKKENETFSYFEAYKKSGEKDILSGYVFLTSDLAPEVKGYGGPIDLVIGTDTSGKIEKVHILSNFETQSYTTQFDSFLVQFIGKTPDDIGNFGKDIDTISRATISSNAMILSIQKSLGKMFLNNSFSLEQENTIKIHIDEIIIPILLFVFFLLSIKLKKPLLRWIVVLTSITYLGFIKASMISVVQFANIAIAKTPSIFNNQLWYMLIVLSLLSLLFFNNIYCGAICPFGGVQDIINRIFRKLRIKQLPATAATRKARAGRFVILFAVLISAIILGSSTFAEFEAFILMFSAGTSLIGMFFVTYLLLVSVFHPRFWCRYLCPIGGLGSLIPNVNSRAHNKNTHSDKNFVKSDILFLLLILISYIFIFSISLENAKTAFSASKDSNATATNIISTQTDYTFDNSLKKSEIDSIKSTLEQKGIKPYPAKYWRNIENEQNSPM